MEQMDNIEKVYLVTFSILIVGILFLGARKLE